MLVDVTGQAIRKSVTLSAGQAQALVDLESMLAGMGVQFGLHCKSCQEVRQATDCTGEATPTDDGGMSFSVTCLCTARTYTGKAVRPPINPPSPNLKPRKNLEHKSKRQLTRREMGIIHDAESVMVGLRLHYKLYCMRCRATGEDSDGIYGRAGNAERFVAECACTVRTYAVPSVGATVQ
jgi:hypothetical protein